MKGLECECKLIQRQKFNCCWRGLQTPASLPLSYRSWLAVNPATKTGFKISIDRQLLPDTWWYLIYLMATKQGLVVYIVLLLGSERLTCARMPDILCLSLGAWMLNDDDDTFFLILRNPSWWIESHAMQNWIYFCGICQMTPLKVWLHTAQSCNHQ